jgi:hypothetical protein
MNAREARRILAGTLHFGDATQIRARQSLERILIAKEFIEKCSRGHFEYTYSVKEHSRVEYLEEFEEEVLDCEECCFKIKQAEGLLADELLAAVAELFDDWWEHARV